MKMVMKIHYGNEFLPTLPTEFSLLPKLEVDGQALYLLKSALQRNMIVQWVKSLGWGHIFRLLVLSLKVFYIPVLF